MKATFAPQGNEKVFHLKKKKKKEHTPAHGTLVFYGTTVGLKPVCVPIMNSHFMESLLFLGSYIFNAVVLLKQTSLSRFYLCKLFSKLNCIYLTHIEVRNRKKYFSSNLTNSSVKGNKRVKMKGSKLLPVRPSANDSFD